MPSSKPPQSREPAQFWVYVIELDAEALADVHQRNLGKGALYVGCSSHPPEHRLQQHQGGEYLAAAVFRRMKDPTRSRLRMDLCLNPGPFATQKEGEQQEADTHRALDEEGYRVFGNIAAHAVEAPRSAKAAKTSRRATGKKSPARPRRR